MRVVDRATFLKLPAGVIYAKGVKWAFGSLCVKGETTQSGNDWLSFDPCWIDAYDSGEAFGRLEEMLATGASVPMETAESRDGCYEDDSIFLVFEPTDLVTLRGHIDAAINNPW